LVVTAWFAVAKHKTQKTGVWQETQGVGWKLSRGHAHTFYRFWDAHTIRTSGTVS